MKTSRHFLFMLFSVLFTCFYTIEVAAQRQIRKRSDPETTYAVDKKNETSPVYIGIVKKLPTNTPKRMTSFDSSGNVYYRDISSFGSDYWSLIGNSGTDPVTNFIGTTDNTRFVIRTNNTERMTVSAAGAVGIGTNNPVTNFHVVESPGAITGAPYEMAVFEKNGDAKMAIYNSSSNPIPGGTSISLGYSNFVNTSGRYPGYEMQFGATTLDDSYLQFNAIQRNASGNIVQSVQRVLFMDNNGNVGINLGNPAPGTPNYPTAKFHTNGTVRHQNLPTGTGDPVLIDANGNLFVGNSSTGNAWNLVGNSGTNPATNFIGTTDNTRFVVRTNNSERMTVSATGSVGIGTNNPLTKLHVVESPGAITGAPYEMAVFEKNGDAKMAIYNSSPNPIPGGTSISLGYSNFVNASGQYPGYEMQFGASSSSESYLQFNAIQRNTSGSIVQAIDRVFLMDNNGNVGINLGNPAPGAPNYPTAKFHTNGTVRHQNLPSGTGNVLVVDARGNVFRSSTVLRQTDMEKEIAELKEEVESLKAIVNSLKNGFMTVNTNEEASLFQNAPNPFNHTTIIRFVLPAHTQTASIEIGDLAGKVLKTVRLSGSGQQSATVTAGELSAGTYFYSLIVNGRKIDSKKMILTR